MEVLKHIFKQSWLAITAIILLLLFLQSKCSNKTPELIETQTAGDQTKFYFEKYLSENAKRLENEKKSKELVLVYQNKLKYWQNRKQISKTFEPIEDIIDCNDTIKKIKEIAHVNDSLCIDLVSRSSKVLRAKDSVIRGFENENNFLLKSLENKNLENNFLKNNNDILNKNIIFERRKKTFWKIATATAFTFATYKSF